MYILQQSLSFLKTMFNFCLPFGRFPRIHPGEVVPEVYQNQGLILLDREHPFELQIWAPAKTPVCHLLPLTCSTPDKTYGETNHPLRFLRSLWFRRAGFLIISCWSDGTQPGSRPSFSMKIWSDADIHLLFRPIHLCFIGRSKFGVESGWAWFKGSSPESIVFGRTQLPEWLESP